MNESTKSEEQFHDATLALAGIANEAELERDEHDGTEFVSPRGKQEVAPLKGPHHAVTEK